MTGPDRRHFLGLASSVAVVGCYPRQAASEGTYSTVDSFSELAVSPDGRSIAVHPMGDDPSTILLVDREFREPITLTFPVKHHWVRDLAYAPDGHALFFSVAPPPFDRTSKVYRLDLQSRRAQAIDTGQRYSRAPALGRDGSTLAFVGRGEGGPSLHAYELALASGLSTKFAGAAFQSVDRLKYEDDQTLLLGCVPGTDPFDSLKLDQASGFARAFRLPRDGELEPLMTSAVAQASVGFADVGSEAKALLIVRSYAAPPETFARLVTIDRQGAAEDVRGDMGFVAGKQIAMAAMAADSHAIALNLIDNPGAPGSWQARKTVAFLGGANARVTDLQERAVSSVMIV